MLPHQNQSLVLRELHTADAAWMESLHALSFDAPQRWNADAFRSLVSQKLNKSTVLSVGYTPIAFMIARHVADEGEILTLAVHPQHRRKGYAKILVETFIEEESRHGLQNVFLEVMECNAGAIKLYEAMDFKIISKRPDYYQTPSYVTHLGITKRTMDGYLMERKLIASNIAAVSVAAQHTYKPH